MEKGWIKLHRRIVDWEWYQDRNVFSVFLHCILKANHKPKKWQGIQILRGEFITSYKKLSEELSGRHGGVTVMQVRTAIKKLISTGEITIKPTNKYTIIQVQNYDSFQEDNKQDNIQITNKEQTNNIQVTTTKNEKEIENDKEIISPEILSGGDTPPKKPEKEIEPPKDEDFLEMARFFYTKAGARFLKNNQQKATNLEILGWEWAWEFEKMVRLDGATKEECWTILEWLFSMEKDAIFWLEQTHAPTKFRKLNPDKTKYWRLFLDKIQFGKFKASVKQRMEKPKGSSYDFIPKK